ncbi:MAG TPA: protein kinase [Gemmatimonadales bacterium]|nr:protein kinase [Gemmatimonadales bacterium]
MTDPLVGLSAALANRYRLERELGAGGMATVYLAQDLKHDRRVAIKVLRPELAAVIGADRFLSEIKTTANLQHPHILPLHDSGAADSFLYYVMPFIEGESLRDRLNREKQLPIADAVRIATEVAGALDYAHRHNVVHRDIKPENILLHDGRALVADFGIALAASKAGGTRMTETGMSLGTPTYMSPEQAMGEREITPRSDVYALGCVLYEMLLGEPPFTGPTAQAIVAKVMTAAPTSLTTQRKSIPPQVEAAVFTALEKLPADRFASAKEFADALGDPRYTAAGRPEAATGLSPRGATISPRLLVAALAVVASLLIVAAIGWLRPVPAPATSRQRVTLWHTALGQFLSPGVVFEGTQAAIAPDGSSIVFCDGVSDSARLMLKPRNEAEARPMAGTEGGVSPFFSPDGRWIGFLTLNGRLRKVPLEGGGAVTLATDANVSYLSAAWLEDGSIVYMSATAELRRISAEGGSSRPVRPSARPERVNLGAFFPLPGSRGFLYTRCPGNCAVETAVYVFDFAADSGRLLVPNAAGAWYSPTGHLLYTDRAGGLYAAGFDAKRLVLTSGAVPVIEGVVPVSFAISASGSVLYQVGSGGAAPAELLWVSRDGRTALFDSAWKADFQYPALSPDGKALAVGVHDGSTQIWIRRSDGTRQKLTDSGSVNWRASWLADGRAITFSSNRRGGGNQDDYDIYQQPVDGSAPARLLLHHTFGLWEAETSRDGQWLVVRSDEAEGKSSLRGRRLQGDTALVPLVVDQGLATYVSLSPDGHWLAYGSDRTGRREIYVTSFPNATTTQLVSRDGGTEPRWAHSGRELFFKGPSQLMVVPVTGGPSFAAGTPRPLFSLSGYREARNRQQYDVAPDDRRFVMIRESSSNGSGNIIYVENWLAELEAKVKGKR